jgi:MHS family proline/betaine transporter-like MFS transporter
MLTWSFLAYLSGRVYPLKIIKIRMAIFYSIVLFLPYVLNHATASHHILFVQLCIVIFGVGITPAAPIFFKNIPVLQRFTCYAFMYALSRALIYIIVSFGTVYLVKYFGNYGILFIVLPIGIGLVWAINHFEELEIESGNHPVILNKRSLV